MQRRLLEPHSLWPCQQVPTPPYPPSGRVRRPRPAAPFGLARRPVSRSGQITPSFIIVTSFLYSYHGADRWSPTACSRVNKCRPLPTLPRGGSEGHVLPLRSVLRVVRSLAPDEYTPGFIVVISFSIFASRCRLLELHGLWPCQQMPTPPYPPSGRVRRPRSAAPFGLARRPVSRSGRIHTGVYCRYFVFNIRITVPTAGAPRLAAVPYPSVVRGEAASRPISSAALRSPDMRGTLFFPFRRIHRRKLPGATTFNCNRSRVVRRLAS